MAMSDSISASSSMLLPEDSVIDGTPRIDPSKKISSATKKRLEAIRHKEEKKEKAKTPRKKKMSIFQRKMNPGFFKKPEEEKEPKEIEIAINDAQAALPEPKEESSPDVKLPISEEKPQETK